MTENEQDLDDEIETDPHAEQEAAYAEPQPPGGPKAFYGLVLDEANSSAHVQVWKPTYDVADLALPPEKFVPCTTRAEGFEELRARNPVPPPPGADADGDQPDLYPVTRVAVVDKGGPLADAVVVADRPALEVLPRQRYIDTRRFVRTAAAYGGVYVEVPHVTRPDSQAWGRHNCSDSLVRAELYGSELYRASDLVLREVKLKAPGFDRAYLVLPNAEKAACRRKRAENDAKRRAEEEKKEAAAREVRTKREAEVSRLNQAGRLLTEAADRLWRDVPELTAIVENPYHYYHSCGAATHLRRVVAVHEKFRGRGTWRTYGYVAEPLARYHAERQHVGSKGDSDHSYYVQTTYKTDKDGSQQAVEAPNPKTAPDRDWLLKEAARAHRALKRKREQAAQPPAPPPKKVVKGAAKKPKKPTKKVVRAKAKKPVPA